MIHRSVVGRFVVEKRPEPPKLRGGRLRAGAFHYKQGMSVAKKNTCGTRESSFPRVSVDLPVEGISDPGVEPHQTLS